MTNRFYPRPAVPVVQAWPRNGGIGLVTDDCPYCGYHHEHGFAYGGRLSHCHTPFVGGHYILIPATKPKPDHRHLAVRPTYRQKMRWQALGITHGSQVMRGRRFHE